MKNSPLHENEIVDINAFHDPAQAVVTAVMRLPPQTMHELVAGIKSIVRSAHRNSALLVPDKDGIVRAQIFEEGSVFMLERPFAGFAADRYLMDFFDVNVQGVCSRMHVHTGARFVRIMTGPDTQLRISSLSEIRLEHATEFHLAQIKDDMPGSTAENPHKRYSIIVPCNSIVDMQIPAGVSHQFNADGPNAVIDSIHPEEGLELFRENINAPNMMAQTIFLASERPLPASCLVPKSTDHQTPVWRQAFNAAASVLLAIALPIFGMRNLEDRIKDSYRHANPNTIEITFKNATALNILHAYPGPKPVMHPQSILLPQGIHYTLRIQPESRDPDRLAEAHGITLRKTRGVIDPDQTVFEYMLTGDGKTEIVTVTPENLNENVGRLERILGL